MVAVKVEGVMEVAVDLVVAVELEGLVQGQVLTARTCCSIRQGASARFRLRHASCHPL